MAGIANKISYSNFLDSELCARLRVELKSMTDSPVYNTHVMSLIDMGADHSYFVEKHLKYISSHPKMDPWQYVQNLKLMTKLKI